jgi:diguanylate cyclase (GGDEF)-like protein
MRRCTEAVSALYAEYAREAAAELGHLLLLLGRLEREPGDRDLLEQLMRGFHSFAGSGGTFGVPALSAIGSQAEGIAMRALTAAAPLTAAERQLLAALATAIAAQLAEVPRAEKEARHAPSVAAALPAAGLSVVVAAGQGTRRSLLPRLRVAGFEVREARGAAEAVRQIEAALPDALVADVELPDGSGYQLAEAVRRLPHGRQVAVILAGSRQGPCDQSAAIYSGADAVLEQPVDWERVSRQLLQLHAARSSAGRVLVVDDDARHAELVREILGVEGYEVRWCGDPRRFGAELDAFHPHLVLMDVLMPGTTGYELVRLLRGNELYAGLPVLFLTTQGQIAARIAVVRAGGDDHFVKPVSRSLLVSAVKARIERSRRMQDLLETDGLTRLLTRSALLDRARAITAGERANPRRPPVWVMIDLDHFKSVNDRHGHAAGDRVLAATGGLLRRRLRMGDVVGRYGGEELTVLLEGLSPDAAVRLADRIRAELADEEIAGQDGGPPFQVTFSAGVAPLLPGMSWEDWRDAADRALYEAKRAGRNQVVLAGDAAADVRRSGSRVAA